MKQELRIWADNSAETHKLIKQLNNFYVVTHILSASPEPVARSNGDLVVGLSSIYSLFVASHSSSKLYSQVG